MRWEPYIPQHSENERLYHFDLNAFNQGLRTTQYKNAPPGLFYAGDPGFPGTSGITNSGGIFLPGSDWPGIRRATARCPFEPQAV